MWQNSIELLDYALRELQVAIEKNKVSFVYDPSVHHYTSEDPADFYEVEKHHYVRCNLEELKKYKAIIAKLKEGAKHE